MQALRFDWLLLLTVCLLLAAGGVFSYSASSYFALHIAGDQMFFFRRHLFALVLGIAGFFFAWHISIDRVFAVYKVAVIGALICLIAVFVPGIGRRVSGASRWIDLGFISFQSSELAKPLMLIYFAKILSLKKDRLHNFSRGILPPISIATLVIGLISLEPDLSTALLFGLVIFSMLYLARVPFVYLLTVLAFYIPLFLLLLEVKRYSVRRFAVLNPFEDPFGRGYHLIQSFLCFRNGGWFGVGLGRSTQKIGKLPEAHTDFIFSIIGEETGILGASMIIFLFVLLIWRGFAMAERQIDMQRSLLAYGITFIIGLEALIHLFVTLGLSPTTGLPLPLISYGRSSIVVHLFMIGLLINLSRSNDSQRLAPGRS